MGAIQQQEPKMQGTMRIIIQAREEKKSHITRGDMSYEAMIMEEFVEFQKNWICRLEDTFHTISDEQSERTMQATYIFEAMMHGWGLSPTILVDLNEACYRNLTFVRSNKKTWEESLEMSMCGKAMHSVYDIVGELTQKGTNVRAYAGGGVSAPTPGNLDNCEHHPSHGIGRSIAIPLADELDLYHRGRQGKLKRLFDYLEKKTNADPLYRLVHQLMKRGQTQGSWGGFEYAINQSYP
jgi:hypothetical protein